ncbi:MAG TPA: hypothetical protein V6C98_07600, partial [Thermosynechococcaceae cyanobacterium]
MKLQPNLEDWFQGCWASPLARYQAASPPVLSLDFRGWSILFKKCLELDRIVATKKAYIASAIARQL